MKSIFMKLFIIGLCVSFFPIQAIAQGGQTGFFTINALDQRQCIPNQGFEITLTADHTNPDGCSNPRVLELSCDEKWYLPSVAVFLTAFSLNKEVQMEVDGCDTDGQAIVKAVQMRYSIERPPPEGDVVRVFVTQDATYQGDIGGVVGADAICQEAAVAAGLTGSDWTAWLSDGGANAIDRIPEGVYLDTVGNLIATGKRDLTTEKTDPNSITYYLRTAINHSEYGNVVSEYGLRVWTGTRATGFADAGQTCADWTDADEDPAEQVEGVVGYTTDTNTRWTAMTSQPCGQPASLYCFGSEDKEQ